MGVYSLIDREFFAVNTGAFLVEHERPGNTMLLLSFLFLFIIPPSCPASRFSFLVPSTALAGTVWRMQGCLLKLLPGSSGRWSPSASSPASTSLTPLRIVWASHGWRVSQPPALS